MRLELYRNRSWPSRFLKVQIMRSQTADSVSPTTLLECRVSSKVVLESAGRSPNPTFGRQWQRIDCIIFSLGTSFRPDKPLGPQVGVTPGTNRIWRGLSDLLMLPSRSSDSQANPTRYCHTLSGHKRLVVMFQVGTASLRLEKSHNGVVWE